MFKSIAGKVSKTLSNYVISVIIGMFLVFGGLIIYHLARRK